MKTNVKNTIKNWAVDDRPREKLILKGAAALSDAELLAILIGTGTKNNSALAISQEIVKQVDFNLNLLGKFDVKQFMEFDGIGQAKAVVLIAAMELGKRRKEFNAVTSTITHSKQAFQVMHPLLSDLLHEEFWVLYLNNSKKMVHKAQISKGGMTATVIDSRIIFKTALVHNATSVILCHNHPSGNKRASNEDIKQTKLLYQAGLTLSIEVLDHLILMDQTYVSFADMGLMDQIKKQ
ncbi:MAG: DNA repair protein RadC [Flavobacterium sp.]|nr:DNA repair protein RadC [Candidatus Neoflavobacterium equi]